MAKITTIEIVTNLQLLLLLLELEKEIILAVSLFINQSIQTTKSNKEQQEYQTTIHNNQKQ